MRTFGSAGQDEKDRESASLLNDEKFLKKRIYENHWIGSVRFRWRLQSDTLL